VSNSCQGKDYVPNDIRPKVHARRRNQAITNVALARDDGDNTIQQK
jgi:hypothetical protein